MRTITTRSLLATAAATLALTTGCVHPKPLPPSAAEGQPTVAAVVTADSPKVRDRGGLTDVAFKDLMESYGLKVSLDMVTGRRVCNDERNEVVVMPSTKSIQINNQVYPLEGMIRWRHGVLYLPGTARALLAENLRAIPIPEVAHDPELFDGSEPVVGWGSRKRTTRKRIRRGRPLPAAWRVRSRRSWKYIVIHHSATQVGDAKSFHRSHSKKWQNGLGYHFVIGNGTTTPDGKVQVGPRWTRQNKGIDGAHAGNKRYNRFGIGICLVGDFNGGRPSPRQLVALRRLCKALMSRYRIPRSRIYQHQSVRRGHTDCPGKNFPFRAFVRSLH